MDVRQTSAETSDIPGLLHALILDGNGGARRASSADITAWTPDSGTLWVHLDRTDPDVPNWLRGTAKLDRILVDSLLAEETHPRCVQFGDGVLLVLRAINADPHAKLRDMVAPRLWVDQGRVISLRRSRTLAIEDVRRALKAGRGPKTESEFLSQLIDFKLDRIAPIITKLADKVDDIDEQILRDERGEFSKSLSELRREAIGLRRYIAPQREVIGHLPRLELTWLQRPDRRVIIENANRLTLFVEDLDSVRERALVSRDELESRSHAKTEKTTYVLSLVAAIFLPITFVTGLMGANVGGIPGADSEFGFWILSGMLVGISALLLLIFRWLKWF